MKNYFIALLTVLLLGITGIANATLFDLGNGIIHDNVSDLYWFQDLAHFTNQTYDQQIITIADLNTNNTFTDPKWENWHMADEAEVNTLWEYEASVFLSMFTPTNVNYYPNGTPLTAETWRGRISTPGSIADTHLYRYNWHNFRAGTDGTWYKDTLFDRSYHDTMAQVEYGAWVVATAAPPLVPPTLPSVPEPATMILFGIGLIGFAGVSRNKNKL